MNNFIDEIRWRGFIQDITPGTENIFKKNKIIKGYIGFDPSSDSLHIGSLMPIMLLVHFQKAGHKAIALLGGATGMIGDPSGKSEERKLLSEDELNYNLNCIKKQLEKFLDFKSKNPAEIVNNYDWFKNINLLHFLRNIGKHITVNYMISKDSVKKRMEKGLSFTEFSYQLIQAYDFLYLFENKNCILQMGGSDQWGNITTGIELIRRKTGKQSYAFTCPLLIQSDGKKFGKTETGNIWLDPKKTSPYKFYQFWLNISDDDAKQFIKIFTLLSKKEIENLILKHNKKPHLRILQKELAKDITKRVHSESDYKLAAHASNILFGKSTAQELKQLDENTFLEIFDGVPIFNIAKTKLENGIDLFSLLVESNFFASKNEIRRLFKSNSISLNKEKVNENKNVTINDAISGKYLLIQKGKKNYFLIVVK